MADQTDFDADSYTDTLVEGFLEVFPDFYDRESYDAHDALSEAVWETTDEYLAYTGGHFAIAVLDHSDNDPDEWAPYAEGKDDWEDVVTAMAFTVVRQDIYDALEDEGYLDEGWSPTDKLRGVAE